MLGPQRAAALFFTEYFRTNLRSLLLTNKAAFRTLVCVNRGRSRASWHVIAV